MRILLAAALGLLILTGCTASDKDYVRNHVVLANPIHVPPVTP